MKRIIIATLFIWALCIVSSAIAQSRNAAQWSVMVDMDWCTGVSSTMRGSADDFANQFATTYANNSYPFAGVGRANVPAGIQVLYELADMNAGPYLAYHITEFQADNLSSPGPHIGNALIDVNTLTIGGEYALGMRGQEWSPFFRVGINLNWISGFFEYTQTKTYVANETRIGVEGESGMRWNIPGAPVALEVSGNYLNANLLGKSYTRPLAQPPDELGQRRLNDGADPDNPSDHSRTIDYVSVRLGMRYSF